MVASTLASLPKRRSGGDLAPQYPSSGPDSQVFSCHSPSLFIINELRRHFAVDSPTAMPYAWGIRGSITPLLLSTDGLAVEGDIHEPEGPGALLTPSCQYALRALVHLGRSETGQPLLARDIAAAESIPQAFLSKILQSLVQSGLVRSQKGPGGGYVLNRPAGQITVEDVMAVVDGTKRPEERCLFGHPECNSLVACPVHDAWSSIRARFHETVGTLTIRELVAQANP